MRPPLPLLLALGLLLALIDAAPALAQPAGPGAPAPAPAPAPRPIVLPAATPGGAAAAPQTVVINAGPSMDQLRQEAPDLFQQVLGGLLGGVDQGLTDVLDAARGLNFLTRTPPELSYRQPDVLRLWGATRAVADGALALILMVGGYNVMLRRSLGERYEGALALLPRVLVGALLANLSMWWAGAAIDAENALCAAVGGQLPDARRFLPLLAAGGLLWTPLRLLLALALLCFLVVGLLLVFQLLMRLVLIDVLLILAPLALVCWILPQTQGWARRWSTAFVGAVLSQFLQVLGLVLAANLVAPFGAGSSGAAAALGPLLGLAGLWLVLKLPALLGHHVGDGSGLVRGVVLGTAARAVAPPAARALGGTTRSGGRP